MKRINLWPSKGTLPILSFRQAFRFTIDPQIAHEPAGHRKPRMEMGPRQGSVSGPEVLVVVCIDDVHLVRVVNFIRLPISNNGIVSQAAALLHLVL